MVTTLCSSGAIILKAGANVSTSPVEANYTSWINQAEGQLGVDTTKDWVTNFAGLSANIKSILELACSNLAAMYLISYDMSGYTSRAEAQTMLDVLWNGYNQAVKSLREKQKQTFMAGVA